MKSCALTRWLIFATLMLGGVLLAPAQTTVTWVGSASPGNWSNNTNWSASYPSAFTTIARFNVNTTYDPVVNSNRSAGELLFQGTANQNFTGTNTLTINGIGGIGIDNTVNYTPTFANPFKLNASNTWQATNTSGGGLSFSGAINLNGKALTLNPLNAVNTITISSVLSSTGGSLVISGAGTTVLSGSNTYTGGTTVSSGTVQVKNANALSNAGTVTFSGNGTLQAGSAGLTIARAIAVNSGVAATVDTQANTFTLSGVISGAGGVTKIGTGTLVMSGSANTYTGATNINAGTLQTNAANLLSNATDVTVASGATYNLNNFSDTVGSIAGAGNVTLGTGTLSTADNSSTTFSGVMSGSGGFTKGGTGTLTFTNANTYTGATAINAGTLNIQNAGAVGTASTNNVTVNSGATLALQGGITVADAGQTLTLNGAGASGAAGALVSAGPSGQTNEWDSAITLGSNATIGSADSLLIVGANGSGNTITLGSNTLTLNTTSATAVAPPGYTGVDPSNLFINETIGASGDTGGVLKTGPGTATFYMGSNNYTGATTITGGKLILDVTTGGNNGILGNIFIGNAGHTGAPDTVFLQQGEGSAPVESNVIADTSTMTIYEDGQYNLNNQNETFATLVLQGGHVNEGVLASNPLLQLTTGVTTNASAQTALINNGNLGLDNSAFTFNIAKGATPSGVDLEVDSVLQNAPPANPSVSLTKSGAGTLVLTGTNTYLGTTTVSAGVLNIQNAAALGAADGTAANGTSVSSGAQLQLQGGINFLNTNTANSEALILNGTGISNDGALRNVGGNNTWNGVITLGSASRINADAGTTLTINNTAGLSSTIISASTAGTALTVGGSGNTVVNGGIGNNVGALTKDGSGTLTLAGANYYTGATAVTAGAALLTNNNGLSGTGTTVSSGAALQLANNVSVNASNLTLNGTGLGNNGALENVSGNNTFSVGGSANIILGSASRINADTGTTLTLSSVVNTTNITGTGQALTMGGAGNINYVGSIQTGSGGTLTKDGAGTVTLGGTANTFTGLTTVSAGTLAMSANYVYNNATSANVINLAGGGTLNLGNFVQSASMITGTGTVAFGTNAASSQLTLNGTGTFSGSFTGTGTLILAAGSSLTLGANFTDANLNIILAGGSLFLNNNSHTFGSLTVTSASILDFGSGASLAQFGSVTANAQLTVKNWTNAVDYFYSTGNAGVKGTAPLNNIVFDPPTWVGNNTAWLPYADGPDNNHQITPVPEPGVYGAGLLLIAFGFVGCARRRARRAG